MTIFNHFVQYLHFQKKGRRAKPSKSSGATKKNKNDNEVCILPEMFRAKIEISLQCQ